MPLSPPLMLEVGNGTKFQSLPLFNIVGPTLGLTKNLGACHLKWEGFNVMQISHLVQSFITWNPPIWFNNLITNIHLDYFGEKINVSSKILLCLT
jgi:hypothetical protein